MLAVSGERPVPHIFLVYALLCSPETLDNRAMIRRDCYIPMTKRGGAIKAPGREAAAGACYGASRYPRRFLKVLLRHDVDTAARVLEKIAAAIFRTRPVSRPGHWNSSIQPQFPIAAEKRSVMGELGGCAPESERVVSLLLPTRAGNRELGHTWRLRNKAWLPANPAGRSPHSLSDWNTQPPCCSFESGPAFPVLRLSVESA